MTNNVPRVRCTAFESPGDGSDGRKRLTPSDEHQTKRDGRFTPTTSSTDERIVFVSLRSCRCRLSDVTSRRARCENRVRSVFFSTRIVFRLERGRRRQWFHAIHFRGRFQDADTRAFVWTRLKHGMHAIRKPMSIKRAEIPRNDVEREHSKTIIFNCKRFRRPSKMYKYVFLKT